jgi:hypothetical protein
VTKVKKVNNLNKKKSYYNKNALDIFCRFNKSSKTSTNLLKKHLGQKIVVFHIFKINYLKNEEID